MIVLHDVRHLNGHNEGSGRLNINLQFDLRPCFAPKSRSSNGKRMAFMIYGTLH